MNKRIIAVFTALISAVVFAGCFSGCSKNTEKEDSINIVASFYPMYIFTINLTKGIDNVNVSSMTEQNIGCLHDYQLVTDDLVQLSDADLFVTNGAGMESFTKDVTDKMPNLKIVEASSGIDLLPSGNGETEYNSHVWMSVPNAEAEVSNIADALIEIMPESKDIINANKEAYLKTLDALDSFIRTGLKDYEGDKIVTFHEAYAYFAKEYGLTVAATIESEDGAEPSTKELAKLSELIKDEKIKALFTEKQYKGTAANTLSKETGASVYVLNPVTSGDMSLTAYQDIMSNNLSIIEEALR